MCPTLSHDIPMIPHEYHIDFQKIKSKSPFPGKNTIFTHHVCGNGWNGLDAGTGCRARAPDNGGGANPGGAEGDPDQECGDVTPNWAQAAPVTGLSAS